MAFVIGGCARQQPAPAETKRTVWQYHIETLESSARENRSKLSEQFDKLPLEAWAKKSTVVDKMEGQFYPTDTKLNELGKDGWELVSSYIEPETVWPNIAFSELDQAQRQPNFRGARLVMVFKRPL